MNILITGAGGFIGSALLEKLSAAHAVRGLTSGDFDLSDAAQTQQFIDGAPESFDAIVHCAAVTPFGLSQRNADRDEDLRMAQNIVSIAGKTSPSKLIFISGWVVYDPSSTVPITETARLNPHTDYGKRKVEVETYFKENMKQASVICLRLSTVYGPGQKTAGLIPNLSQAALEGKPLSIQSADTKRDYVYIDDVITAVRKVLENNDLKSDVINIGGDASHRIVDVAQTIAQQAEELFGLKKQDIEVASANATDSVPDNRLDITKARELLKFTPRVSLQQGIAHYLTWLKTNR